ncbi:bifunctional DNA-formamidopyrimidine glycosylase/DNA-(apurinic or apyrimidinic site) lyase [Candidatus Daviesbacteria bacterium]|nr:bifunctional DNA-formamidopyrimidine glycosylase/DNA-(apurinic or apyrimidinic site) lyase [Candidatus Daviesbacteria bacterium]
MPELPEVETIRLGLRGKIVGLKIKDIQVFNPKSFIGSPKNLRGQKILKIWRRAKILGMELGMSIADPAGSQPHPTSSLVTTSLRAVDGAPRSPSPALTLLFHLKMSGQLVFVQRQESRVQSPANRFIGGHPTEDMMGELPNKSTRVIFEFSDGSKLYFNDQRKFGWIRLISKFEIRNSKFFSQLGPEPLEKDFTWQVLKNNLLKHKSMPVKVAIMDQSAVSGVGNIYANEACFDAKIDPRMKVGSMDDNQFKRLHKGIIKCLKDGIKYGGSSKVHFVNPEGKKGYFLDYAYVYWKEGERCKICGAEIKKMKLGGRGTYYCPKCQK